MARTVLEAVTELGRQLEKERLNRHLTKGQWVEVLDTSVPTYNNWCTRWVDIERGNVKAIAQVLGVDMSDVYEWIRDNKHFREVLGRTTQPRPRLVLAA